MFCKGLPEKDEEHTRKQCPLFKQLKRKTSYNSYIDVEIREPDANGYAASGILPWRRSSTSHVEMLLAREFRVGGPGRTGDKLNFLGGKRRKKEPRPLDCAVDKVYDETAGQLSATTMAHMREGHPLVCWNSESKYVFFLFELVGEDDCEVDIRCAGIPGAKRLEWVTREQLLDSTWTHS